MLARPVEIGYNPGMDGNLPLEISRETRDTVRAHLLEGRYIEAVKGVRNRHPSASLKTCRDTVDAEAALLGLPPRKPRAGCCVLVLVWVAAVAASPFLAGFLLTRIMGPDVPPDTVDTGRVFLPILTALAGLIPGILMILRRRSGIPGSP